ncbi:uncharacterized protein RAG0_04488 [Rhynchosporium agropyri]|uniref:N-acetyltransferase domain-containing protein n=1 Tax=Rhynchosporium agropyri TaxID=914238 RepID=A0A1E1K9E8_9HELO|nr:uncharacterized protein RAG0_04488 [Rhynchosporium agropyri]
MSKLEESQDGVSEATFSALSNHLPTSIALYRRLQFMNMQGGKTANSHVLSLFECPEIFTVAYLDFSRGPETEMWIYSSTERLPGSEIEARCQRQILEILERMRFIESSYVVANGARLTPGIVFIGSLHEKTLNFLEERQRVNSVSEPFLKYVFKSVNLPPAVAFKDGDLDYSEIRKRDIPLVLSRSPIPRRERTVVLFPSVAIAVDDEPVAWGFLGADASLTSLHVEEGRRGQGLAKAVATKLFLDKASIYGPEKLYHADVGTKNLQSQGVCKSLGGKADFCVHWAWIRL